MIRMTTIKMTMMINDDNGHDFNDQDDNIQHDDYHEYDEQDSDDQDGDDQDDNHQDGQGCIFRLCSHPELTKDHVLTMCVC